MGNLFFDSCKQCDEFLEKYISLEITEEEEVSDDKEAELSVSESNDQAADADAESESDDRQTVLEQDEEDNCSVKKKSLLAAAASTWRAAAADPMGDSSNPKWRRVAVRAVQIQDSTKVNGSAGKGPSPSPSVQHPTTSGQAVSTTTVPTTSGQAVVSTPVPEGITPPPGPWGEKVLVENAAVHVDMGKVVGVLRATHKIDDQINHLEDGKNFFLKKPPEC